MKTTHTFAVSALIRKSKSNASGEVPVYIRIIVDGRRVEVSTKHFIKPSLWNPSGGKAKGSGSLAKIVNDTVDLFKLKAKQQYNKLSEAGKEITVNTIKDAVLGIETKQPTFLNVFDQLVSDVKARIGVNYSYSCYCAYVASSNHLRGFLNSKYAVKDIRLKDLNFAFISDFEVYLKTLGKCRQNGAIKHIQRLKMAIKVALKNDYLERDPFLRYSISKEKVVRQPLNIDELNKLINKDFDVERLTVIKDMFLFTCYTGLSFIDAKTLKQENLGIGVDGEHWIFTERQKTGNPCSIPLLPPALEILKKYSTHPTVVSSGYLLPIPSNQKFNAYLKEIADLCAIRKPLTVHIGRHTFATTIAMENGVPIEIVKEILGHDRIETTQIYAKVSKSQISTSMQNLKIKLSS